MIRGADSRMNRANAGAIANIGILGTSAGAVVIDAGTSLGQGRAIRAAAERLAGGRIARVYVTHLHPDHSYGIAAFDPAVVATTAPVLVSLRSGLAAYADGLYRLLGAAMTGTEPTLPGTVVADGVEDIGGRRLRLLTLAGHSAVDLVVLDEVTGTLFAGDLVFHGRAPATPDAQLDRWRAALDRLLTLGHRRVVPGHGPVDPTPDTAIRQTRAWLDWLERTFHEAAARGLSLAEVGELPIPEPLATLAEARYELQRSAVHLYPGVEQRALGPVQRAP
ncbi:MAG: quinoprotein relay system zinc metallohydrolase 1 [Thermaurantiacus sp.]|uniref:quinoprotein relay system zinc metallohydrolase 1 n=1 Tax=Thermaurantiacus sp. TaxID=2820283 RepID=UPI00298EDB21|nr:quinoprotein relay system zinc metallohydrolase 1 [Thermaurantiacus sp.]MDW8415684.1 quinoprotein relay system zinc metallohydrolase 1 [Thermaurantiacus sp.]